MADLFNRRATLRVGLLTVSSFDEVTGQDGLRLQFKVKRSSESTENTAEVSVFGLSENTRGLLGEQIKAASSISAGYADTETLLARGEATEIFSMRQRPGVITQLKIADGRAALRKPVTAAFAPGARVGDVLSKIATEMGVSAAAAIARARAGDFDGGIRQFFNGISLEGTTKTLMDSLARSLGFDYSIQNNELQILNPGEVTPKTAVVLSPSSGMIGSPQRVFDDQRPKAFLVKVRSLLQPALEPGRAIALDAAELQGTFRALTVQHSGDTFGTDWYSDVEAIRI